MVTMVVIGRDQAQKPAEESVADSLARSLAFRRSSLTGGQSDAESDSDTDGKYGHFPGIFFRPPGRRHGAATDASAEYEYTTDISPDSKKFAKTMHECVLDLAIRFSKYWWPVDGGRSYEDAIRVAAGAEGLDDVEHALDLLGRMTAQTIAFSNAVLVGKKQAANLQPLLSGVL